MFKALAHGKSFVIVTSYRKGQGQQERQGIYTYVYMYACVYVVCMLCMCVLYMYVHPLSPFLSPLLFRTLDSAVYVI